MSIVGEVTKREMQTMAWQFAIDHGVAAYHFQAGLESRDEDDGSAPIFASLAYD